MWLKQSTAVTVKLGPFVDETDGKTAETALTISQADIRLSKNGGAYAQTNNAAGATHDEKGNYGVPLDTTDTNTLGTLRVHIHESGALPVWQDFMVVPANVWDSLFGADKLQVHADEITAGLITAAAIADGAIDAGAIASDAITAAKIADGAIDAGAIAADAITAAKIADGAIDAATFAAGAINAAAIASDAITAAKIADGAIDAATFAAGAIDAAAIAANAIGASELAADAVTEIQSGLATTVHVQEVEDKVDAVKAKTDNLPTVVKKNVELANFMFMMIDSSDHVSPKTGLTVTATRSIDGAAFAACANAVAEVSNGWYKITLAAADLNGTTIALKFTATGADQTNIGIVTNT